MQSLLGVSKRPKTSAQPHKFSLESTGPSLSQTHYSQNNAVRACSIKVSQKTRRALRQAYEDKERQRESTNRSHRDQIFTKTIDRDSDGLDTNARSSLMAKTGQMTDMVERVGLDPYQRLFSAASISKLSDSASNFHSLPIRKNAT